MGAYKNFLMEIEELIYEAMEKGFTDTEGVYAYVYDRERRADERTVYYMIERMNLEDYPLSENVN